jgi:SAM-dependent methyltransferase
MDAVFLCALERYASLLNLNDFFNRLFLREFFDRLSTDRGACLLDLGCGNCPYEALYKERFARVIRSDVEVRDSRVDVVSAIEALPFPDGAFDAVLLSEVIEHVDQEHAALSEVYRILKPGGYLLLTWPFIFRLHEIPTDFNRRTEFGMQNLLRRVGFEVAVIRRRGDLLSSFLTIVGTALTGSLEGVTRIPVLGLLLAPVKWIVTSLLSATYWVVAYAQHNLRHLNPGAVGEGLRGVLGALALWPLGYCVMAKKVRPTE